jgi:two-component system, LuxR family, sensor kinase FixL
VLRLAGDLRPVKIERTQIQHVVLNLLRNALEALESVRGTREVIIETYNTAEGLELSVSDNGPGLPQDVRERMFDPFFSTKASGTGLGLTISHSLIRAHGGRLVYEPCSAGGACFRIYLPSGSEHERPVI